MDYSFLDLYTAGWPLVANWNVLVLLFIGVVTGVLIGALPGLTSTMGVAVMTPLTYGLSVANSFALLMGVYCGGVYGGSITAIVAKIPGTPSAMMTTLDGYPMGQRGEAGKAIGIATVSSTIGGLFSAVILSLCAPAIANLALKFSAQEYFAIAIFGLCIISYISEGSITRGLISAILGLLIATIGSDPLTGYQRFSFNQFILLEGIEMIPLLIGIFGLAEVLTVCEKNLQDIQVIQKIGRILPTWNDMKRIGPAILRAAPLGTLVGAIPAAGGTIAAIIAYGVEKRISKHPEKFGTGTPEGIAAPETANNALTGGALIPMLTLGIPGDAASAILIGALLIHGLTPGPNLFNENMPVVSTIFILLSASNILFMIVGIMGAKLITKVINAPMTLLMPVITMFCVVGAYSIRYVIFDVYVLVTFGLIGYIFGKIGIPTAPLVLGFVLGELVENGLRRGMMLARGNYMTFLTRPISTFFLAASLLLLLAPQIHKIFTYRKRGAEESNIKM
jgi:putative tricarboxylic transport membrane protein